MVEKSNLLLLHAVVDRNKQTCVQEPEQEIPKMCCPCRCVCDSPDVSETGMIDSPLNPAQRARPVEREINITPHKRQIMNNKIAINSIIWPNDL